MPYILPPRIFDGQSVNTRIRIKISQKPIGILLRGRGLKDFTEGEDFNTFLVDLKPRNPINNRMCLEILLTGIAPGHFPALKSATRSAIPSAFPAERTGITSTIAQLKGP
jgi:hypothetical protein